MRMNNLSARLTVNEWLERTGRQPLSRDLSYDQFATELWKITAVKNVEVRFASRSDAVAYIRHIANALKAELLKNGMLVTDEFAAAPRYAGSGLLLSLEDASR